MAHEQGLIQNLYKKGMLQVYVAYVIVQLEIGEGGDSFDDGVVFRGGISYEVARGVVVGDEIGSEAEIRSHLLEMLMGV
jgi:hypothetical protein